MKSRQMFIAGRTKKCSKKSVLAYSRSGTGARFLRRLLASSQQRGGPGQITLVSLRSRISFSVFGSLANNTWRNHIPSTQFDI